MKVWAQVNAAHAKEVHKLVIFGHFASFVNSYRKVASASPSHFEAHEGLLRLLMKGIFDPYVL